MKKTIILALLLVGFTATTASAEKKKDKKKQQPITATASQQPVTLRTASDSVSYAAGMSATKGLLEYLQSELKVDSTHMAEFIRGYRDAITKAGDAAYNAYSAGMTVANRTSQQFFPSMAKAVEGTPDSLQSRFFHEGFIAGALADSTLFSETRATEFLRERITAVQEAKNQKWMTENAEWLAQNAKKEGVVTLPSGLQYRVIQQGTGVKPTKEQTVQVVYEGKTIDGNVFDATERHGGKEYDTFRCDQVIKGWTEALTLMPVGSKWELFIPQELAYGNRTAGQIRPYSTLIFTVELKGIEATEDKKVETPQTNGQKTSKTTTAKKGSSSKNRKRR